MNYTQHTVTVGATPYSIKRCLCHIALCTNNYECLDIGLVHNSELYTLFHVMNRSNIKTLKVIHLSKRVRCCLMGIYNTFVQAVVGERL
jgi:hypothetical protein